MGKIIKACLGGKVKFNTAKWNEEEIRLFHDDGAKYTLLPECLMPNQRLYFAIKSILLGYKSLCVIVQ